MTARCAKYRPSLRGGESIWRRRQLDAWARERRQLWKRKADEKANADSGDWIAQQTQLDGPCQLQFVAMEFDAATSFASFPPRPSGGLPLLWRRLMVGLKALHPARWSRDP